MTLPLFGHQQETTTSDDHYTPAWIFEQLDVEFDVDVAAPPSGVPWIPAKKFYTKADDGLAQPWEGRVWMNPPFSGYAPWASKMVKHGNGIALGPLVNTSKWVDAMWQNASYVTLLPSDLKFARPFHDVKHVLWRTALFGFGDWTREPLSRIGYVR